MFSNKCFIPKPLLVPCPITPQESGYAECGLQRRQGTWNVPVLWSQPIRQMGWEADAISRDFLCNAMKTLRYCFSVGRVHDELIIECDPPPRGSQSCLRADGTLPRMDSGHPAPRRWIRDTILQKGLTQKGSSDALSEAAFSCSISLSLGAEFPKPLPKPQPDALELWNLQLHQSPELFKVSHKPSDKRLFSLVPSCAAKSRHRRHDLINISTDRLKLIIPE